MNDISINDILEYEVQDSTNIIDLDLLEQINQIVLNNHKTFSYKNKGKYKSRKQTIDLTIEFYKSINKKYEEDIYKMLLNEQIVFLRKNIEMQEAQLGGYTIMLNDIAYIVISLFNKIDDSFSLSHEIMHSYFLQDGTTLTQEMFCEFPTLLIERIQLEYLRSKNIKELNRFLYNRYNTMYDTSICIDFEIKLLREYMEKGTVNRYFLISLLNTYSDYDLPLIEQHIDTIIASRKLNKNFNCKYIYGYVLSEFYYDKISKDFKLFYDLLDLNKQMNQLEVNQFLSYIGLDTKEDLTLTQQSKDELEKVYINQLKKYR